MNTEKDKLSLAQNPQGIQPGFMTSPQQPQAFIVSNPLVATLPFNVSTDLNMFSRIFIVKEFDKFRIFHCFDSFSPDYRIYGELPDGDKKLLFTSSHHFECCKCCEDCHINFFFCGPIGFLFTYYCCDSIVFQMDYRRNGAPFYTQGINIQKGCYCCKCTCCNCNCCPPSILFLRENIDPESHDFNVGVKKGTTEVQNTCCCSCCRDKTASSTSQEGFKGPTIRAKCCDICKHQCLYKCCYGCTYDFEIDIEDEKGLKVGSIMIYSGCYSQKVEGKTCYCPAPYYEINMPPNCTSEQKFQIIAETVHFDLIYGVV